MAEVISKRSIVYDILFDVESGKRSAKDAEKALKDIGKQAGVAQGQFSNLGKEIFKSLTVQQLVTDAVKQIGQFTREAFELGLKAEGVRKAFKALNNPGLLAELRRATKGTVDDLILMQSAVRADKFKIPLSNLANLLKFARQRAKETGQSVTELSDKIIKGIGKQAAGAFDELGLKQKDIQREFAITGDFAKAVGNIVSREMISSGEDILSNAEKVEQLRTSWQNFKIDVGAALVDSIDDLDGFGAAIANVLAAINPMFAAAKSGVKTMKEFEDQQQRNNEAVLSAAAIYSRLANVQLDTTAFALVEINERLKELSEEFERATDPKIQAGIAQQIQAFQKMKKAIEDLLTAAPAGSIRSLEKQIADLQEALSLTPSTDAGFQKLTAQINKLSEELDRVKTKFTDITKLNKILTTDVQTSTEQLANQFYAVGQAIDEMTADVRIAQTEFIKLADGTMIKGLQTNTVKGMKEVLTEQNEAMRLQRDMQIQYAQEALQSLMQLTEEGSAAHIGFATIAILANQAQALSGAVAAATQAALVTGGTTLPILLPAFIAAALSTFAQMNALLGQAKSEKSISVSAFAEGGVDIHRPGEQPGRDSIPARIMPGESVITTKRTREFKPYLEAIHDGTLKELIQVNHVEPALVMQSLNESKAGSTDIPDYSEKLYRQYLATGEGNMTSKRMARYLASIDRKLTAKSDRYSH